MENKPDVFFYISDCIEAFYKIIFNNKKLKMKYLT